MLGGGAISFGSISIGPAFTAPTIAKSAPAKKSNFIFIGGFCARQSSVLRKLLALVDPHNFGALEAESGHQALLVEGASAR